MAGSLLLARALDAYSVVIVIYAILGWVAMSGGNPVVAQVYRALGVVTEPYLRLFRRFIPVARMGDAGIDFSPVVGLLLLQVVSSFIARLG